MQPIHEVILNDDGSQDTVDVAVTVTHKDAPPVPPVPPILLPAPDATKFGNTPITASNAAGVTEVDVKYGITGQAIRLYSTGVLLKPPVTDRYLVGSFKSMAGLDPSTAAMFDELFYIHEVNAKWNKAGTPAQQAAFLAGWHKDMDTIHSMGIKMAICVTAYGLNNVESLKPFLRDDVTHWGFDYDGISNAKMPYHDIEPNLETMLAFVEKYGLTWSVPEHGANRASDDTNGQGRADWIMNNSGKFKKNGAKSACIWEFKDQGGSLFFGDAEVSTISTLISVG
jgi:hypothetical protein